MSVRDTIKDIIQRDQRGKFYFTVDFLDQATPESVQKALARLEQQNILLRLAHGIYYYPEISDKFGVVHPAIDDIAQAIALRDGVKIRPTGVGALNKLGLSTQVPMKVVYLTDGSPRTVNVGKRTISFKHTTPKNFKMKGEVSYLVIQALREIGKGKVSEDVLKQLQIIIEKK